MPEVVVRDGQRGDARAIGRIWAAAVPSLVRSDARAAADLRADEVLGRRRWVAVLDGECVGTATAQPLRSLTSDPAGRVAADGPLPVQVRITVEVHPDHGSRGVGTALLRAATTAFPHADELHAVTSREPVAMAFAVRNGFLPVGEQVVAATDPSAAPPSAWAREAEPEGLRAVTLDQLPDLGLLVRLHNIIAADDASGLRRPTTLDMLRGVWWDGPDAAPELSWGLLTAGPSGPELVAVTLAQVDRERGRAWTGLTATVPEHRGHGLAVWTGSLCLEGLGAAGLDQAWTQYDVADPAAVALADRLGYRPVSSSVLLKRRLPR